MIHARPPVSMVAFEPPRLPRLVGEVLGTGRLPVKIAKALVDRFWTHHEEGGALTM